MSSEKSNQLKGYGAVPIIEASTIKTEDPNVSWVQAYAIQDPNLSSKYEPLNMDDGNVQDATTSRSMQMPFYRDLPFAVAFLLHGAVMLFLATCFGSFDFGQGAANAPMDSNPGPSFHIAIMPIAIAALTSIMIPYVSIGSLIPRNAKASVLVSLHVSVLSFFLVMMMSFFAAPSIWWFIGIVLLGAYLIWYIQRMKEFVPYAAAMLKIATMGVAKNWGVYIVSFVVSVACVLWSILWVYTANGLGLFDGDSWDNKTSYYSYGPAPEVTAKAFFLLLSLYWTTLVFMNLQQATVAGTIGSYCFEAPSSTCHVTNSLKRSCTTSFGSICFGSLLNGIVITLQVLADWAQQNARDSNDGAMGLLFCCLQCILSLIRDIIEYFNQWCYVFVGIYGFSYIESGNAVVELFKARGCSAILTDALASYVLNTLVLTTGLICGIVGFVCSLLLGGGNLWITFL
jgi:hypothetical protein